MRQEKSSLLRNKGFQSLLASLLCIVLGLLIGYIVLLIINPAGAGEAIRTIVENFLYYPSAAARLRYLGNTLVKTAPLLMCSLSVLFAYKVGLFNIGAAGQYVIGAGASLYCALGFGLPWYVCLLAAIAAGAVLGAISGLLKAYRNVNEVISCIMLNWISLYLVNALLSQVKETASPYTFTLSSTNPDAILPSLGLGALFSDNQYVTIAIPLTVIVAVGIWVLLEKTKLGYELRATGCNKFAAKYCGMKEKRNIILTMAIAGGLAGMGAATLFLTGFEQWQVTQSAVPAMGFNGIAAAFLGGLNPIGAIFSSYFIQHITNGGAYVDKTMYSAQISDLISALIIYLCGFVLFFKVFMNSRLDRRHHGHGRPGRCADDEVPACRHLRLCGGAVDGAGQYPAGHDLLPAAGGGGVLPARRGGDGAVRAGYRGGRRCGRAVCGRLRAAPDEGRGRGIKNRKNGVSSLWRFVRLK